MVTKEQLTPETVVVGRNGRCREIIDIELDDDGQELVIYRVKRSPGKPGKRNGKGYVGACQIPQMLRWARKVIEGDQ